LDRRRPCLRESSANRVAFCHIRTSVRSSGVEEAPGSDS